MKITHPLHSEEAHGTIAGLITFCRRGGQNIARAFHKPGKPATGAQTDQRAVFLANIVEWRALIAAERAVWDLLFVPSPYVSSYHYFLQASDVWHKIRMFGPGKFGQMIFGDLRTKV